MILYYSPATSWRRRGVSSPLFSTNWTLELKPRWNTPTEAEVWPLLTTLSGTVASSSPELTSGPPQRSEGAEDCW